MMHRPTSTERAIQQAKQAAEKAKEMSDEEHALKVLLEKIRKLYFTYGIAGEIEISKGSMMVASLSCEVDGTSGEYYQDPESGFHVNVVLDAIVMGIIKLMMTGVEKMVHDMMHRSKAYWDKSYKDDMTLSGSFTWSDPKGFFTTEITCSATIKSMHAHIFRVNEFQLTYGFFTDKESAILKISEV